MTAHINPAWRKMPEFRTVCAMITGAGFQAYAVGGCVRDALLGVDCADIDIATNARPHDLTKIFGVKPWDGDNAVRRSDDGIALYPTGVAHGTWTVRIGEQAFEVTSFRKDVDTDGRRATVEFADTVEVDAERRDFTFNALYMAPDGSVLDPTGTGVADLQHGIVRFVGDAKARCNEDFLRILRLFRFQARFGTGEVEQNAADAARKYASKITEQVSGERIWAEISKMLSLPNPFEAIKSMVDLGVFEAVFGFTPSLDWFKETLAFENEPGWARRAYSLGIMVIPFPVSNEEQKRLQLLTEMQGSTLSSAALAYEYGVEVARDFHILYRPEIDGIETALQRGRAVIFPVKSSDYIEQGFTGSALGEKLKQAKKRWLESDMKLTKTQLLN